MHFGFALDMSDIDLRNINLFDTHLDLLDKDISKRFQDMSSRCLQDVFKTSSRHVFETSWIRLGDQQMFAGTCLVRRFVLNLKAKQKGIQGLQGSLSVGEMEKSEVFWLMYEQCIVVQRETFEKVKHSLNLVYDEHFLLPSKTRYSEFDKLDTSRKLPLLLRSHSHFTNLVIRDAHEKVFRMVLIELWISYEINIG